MLDIIDPVDTSMAIYHLLRNSKYIIYIIYISSLTSF